MWNYMRRYEQGWDEGLKEHSRRPQNSPARISGAEEGEIMRLRSDYGWGAGRIGAVVGLSSSTVHRVLGENGMCGITLPHKKYPRYEMTHPGELIHVDVKQLVSLRTGSQPEHLFAALDAYSREVFVKVFPRVNGAASQEFLDYVLAEVPYGIQAMMTDNACIFSMRRSGNPERECSFQRALRLKGIEHLLTRPYTPRTNGKVERFFGTLERELLRVVRFSDLYHRREALIRFVSYYNLHPTKNDEEPSYARLPAMIKSSLSDLLDCGVLLIEQQWRSRLLLIIISEGNDETCSRSSLHTLPSATCCIGCIGGRIPAGSNVLNSA